MLRPRQFEIRSISFSLYQSLGTSISDVSLSTSRRRSADISAEPGDLRCPLGSHESTNIRESQSLLQDPQVKISITFISSNFNIISATIKKFKKM